jgi:hypothetical protein
MASSSCIFLVGVSVKLIDRPVSTGVHGHLMLSPKDRVPANCADKAANRAYFARDRRNSSSAEPNMTTIWVTVVARTH